MIVNVYIDWYRLRRFVVVVEDMLEGQLNYSYGSTAWESIELQTSTPITPANDAYQHEDVYNPVSSSLEVETHEKSMIALRASSLITIDPSTYGSASANYCTD